MRPGSILLSSQQQKQHIPLRVARQISLLDPPCLSAQPTFLIVLVYTFVAAKPTTSSAIESKRDSSKQGNGSDAHPLPASADWRSDVDPAESQGKLGSVLA